jgi:hypothetical protein
MVVNRLLKKLQTAIASGQHHEAANIARELARLKVNCNMTRQETPDLMFESSPNGVNLRYVQYSSRKFIYFLQISLSLSIIVCLAFVCTYDEMRFS